MPLDLAFITQAPLTPGTKGLPLLPNDFTLGDIAQAGWNVLAGDLPLPVAVLKRSALTGNIAAMQAYAAQHGTALAPHGKTSMCPELFERQLDAGAWGMTVATAAQAALCQRIGVPRVIIANQLAGAADVALLAALCVRSPDSAFYVLVDSIGVAELLDAGFAKIGCKARVLIELGHDGGRTGVRTVEQGVDLARAVAGLDHLSLEGIEGYEGLIGSPDPVADARNVSAYLDRVVALFDAARVEGLFADGVRPLLTAGGSVYYDLVAHDFATAHGDVQIVLRSGCYVTHDTGFYATQLNNAAARAVLGPPPALTNALEVWTRVQSMPEPDLAILTAGKRDLSHDIDLPQPIAWHPCGTPDAPGAITGWKIDKLSDQHAFLRRTSAVPDTTRLKIGSLVCLGISHPCTTFDKWPVLLEVADDYAVLGGLKTFF